jgi:hypothetical protein
VIILATHRIINKTDESFKFTVGNARIKLEPQGEVEIDMLDIRLAKSKAMQRWLRLVPELHKGKIEVIDLQEEN